MGTCSGRSGQPLAHTLRPAPPFDGAALHRKPRHNFGPESDDVAPSRPYRGDRPEPQDERYEKGSPMISHVPTDRGLSRRALLRAATVAGIAVATGIGPSSATTTRAARGANAMPTLADGLASTPLGDQLAWVLAAVNAGGTGLTDADVAAHFAPSLLAVIPPAQFIGLVQGLAGGYGALTLQGATRPPTATQEVGLVAAAVGIQLALP